ncbi:MAG: hypothetical protein M1438_13000 [Deltaproteobacteria bacterium]|nr:hypothetical protein [Deltaproteobacteria bacterium]
MAKLLGEFARGRLGYGLAAFMGLDPAMERMLIIGFDQNRKEKGGSRTAPNSTITQARGLFH